MARRRKKIVASKKGDVLSVGSTIQHRTPVPTEPARISTEETRREDRRRTSRNLPETEERKPLEPVTLPKIDLSAQQKKKTLGQTAVDVLKREAERTTVIAGVETSIPIGTKISAGVAAGSIGILGGLIGGLVAGGVGTTTAVSTATAQTAGVVTYGITTKAVATTTGLFVKLGLAVGAAGLAVTVIGSYPFAGFIKEEALQTLSLGLKSAINNNDIEGMDAAIAEQKEILNPTVWQRILGTIPYANVLSKLQNFYDAARIKLAIDEKVVEDLKIQIETGETDDDKWKRIRQEEVEQDKAAIDYYNEQRKQMVEWEREAEVAARNADAAFWAKEAGKTRKKEAEDRKAIADFWLAYRKEALKLADNNRPSNLNFGLL